MEQLLLSLCIGGLLGLAGQGIRVIVGIKKTFDMPDVTSSNFSTEFDTKRMLISLFIGVTAGILASLTLDLTTPSKEAISGLIAAGYAGTDFIEGFVRKKIP